MFIYFAFAALAGIIAGTILAFRLKKEETVVYGTLDKIGIATNIVLIPVYAIILTFFWFLNMLGMNPLNGGLLGVISWIVSIFCASVPALCGLGIGASVAWRKKGKSVHSFLVQFAGIAGFAVVMLIFIFLGDVVFASLN
jgi:hypothetical protein